MPIHRIVRWLGAPIAAAEPPAPVAVPIWAEGTTGTVQIVQGGRGYGTITSEPAGIRCTIGNDGASGACAAAFPSFTRVKLRAAVALTATPLAGRTVAGPSGTVPGSTDGTVTMTAAKRCTGTFVR